MKESRALNKKTVVILLCAGKGSRMDGLPPGINKCALPVGATSSVAYNIRALSECDVRDFLIVTGYAENSVKEAARPAVSEGINVTFVNNPKHDYHGCNYSLVCAMRFADLAENSRVIIAEGDSILHIYNIRAMLDATPSAASLVRRPSY